MFEYWTPTGHIFAIVISMMYATYVAKGKIFSKKGILNFLGSVILCYLFTVIFSLIALISAFEGNDSYFLYGIFIIVLIYSSLRYKKIIFAFNKLYEKFKPK